MGGRQLTKVVYGLFLSGTAVPHPFSLLGPGMNSQVFLFPASGHDTHRLPMASHLPYTLS